MLEWMKEMKNSELMNKWFNFSPVYLRCALWKMMIKVDRFYNHECTPEMFEHSGGQLPWPIQI